MALRTTQGRRTKGERKIAKVIEEFEAGTLMSSAGEPVTSLAQARAIALSEARQAGARIPEPKRRRRNFV